MSIREIANYPDAQVAPYDCPMTKITYPDAVYTSGEFTVSSRRKTLSFSIDVYASLESFEAGGEAIGTPIRRTITTETTPNYDDVIMANAQLVGGILVVLNGIEPQMQ